MFIIYLVKYYKFQLDGYVSHLLFKFNNQPSLIDSAFFYDLNAKNLIKNLIIKINIQRTFKFLLKLVQKIIKMSQHS